MMHIHADAQHHIVDLSALALQRHFRQDARDLPAPQQQVVGPFDGGLLSRDALNGTADRHRRQRRQRQ